MIIHLKSGHLKGPIDCCCIATLSLISAFSCTIQNDLHSRTGRDEKKGKPQEKMERGSRKISSSAGSEKMERVSGR